MISPRSAPRNAKRSHSLADLRVLRGSVSALFPRIRGGDDGADGFLVETLEAALALQVFEVAAERAVARKRVGLLARDEPLLPQPRDALRPHPPAFALGERLPQELEVRKWLH